MLVRVSCAATARPLDFLEMSRDVGITFDLYFVMIGFSRTPTYCTALPSGGIKNKNYVHDTFQFLVDEVMLAPAWTNFALSVLVPKLTKGSVCDLTLIDCHQRCSTFTEIRIRK